MQESKVVFGRRIKARLFFALSSIIIVLFMPTYPLLIFETADSFIRIVIVSFSFITFWIVSFKVLSSWYLTDDEFEKTLFNSIEQESIS